MPPAKNRVQFYAKTDCLLDLARHWKGIKTRQHHMGNNTQLGKAPLGMAWFPQQFFQTCNLKFGANRRSKGWNTPLPHFWNSSLRDETHIIICKHQQYKRETFKLWCINGEKHVHQSATHTTGFEGYNSKAEIGLFSATANIFRVKLLIYWCYSLITHRQRNGLFLGKWPRSRRNKNLSK